MNNPFLFMYKMRLHKVKEKDAYNGKFGNLKIISMIHLVI